KRILRNKQNLSTMKWAKYCNI
ncbi:hypothetical protein NPIL_453251, partial [Nephila pilipes]